MHIPYFMGKLGGLPVPSPAPSPEPEVDLGCPPSPAPLCCQGYKWISCRLHILPPLPSSCRVTGRAGWSRMAWGGSRGCRPWGLGVGWAAQHTSQLSHPGVGRWSKSDWTWVDVINGKLRMHSPVGRREALRQGRLSFCSVPGVSCSACSCMPSHLRTPAGSSPSEGSGFTS